MNMDINSIGGLLHIADMAKNWPTLRGLHDLAMSELEAASVEAAKELADRKAKAEAGKVDELKQAQAEIDRINSGKPDWIEPDPTNVAEPEAERRI